MFGRFTKYYYDEELPVQVLPDLNSTRWFIGTLDRSARIIRESAQDWESHAAAQVALAGGAWSTRNELDPPKNYPPTGAALPESKEPSEVLLELDDILTVTEKPLQKPVQTPRPAPKAKATQGHPGLLINWKNPVP